MELLVASYLLNDKVSFLDDTIPVSTTKLPLSSVLPTAFIPFATTRCPNEPVPTIEPLI